MRAGDSILAIDGAPCHTLASLETAKKNAGGVVTLTLAAPETAVPSEPAAVARFLLRLVESSIQHIASHAEGDRYEEVKQTNTQTPNTRFVFVAPSPNAGGEAGASAVGETAGTVDNATVGNGASVTFGVAEDGLSDAANGGLLCGKLWLQEVRNPLALHHI